uniref:Uncharacterized protein n=1 Tax=Amphilophus citrinellus TaxID=61819 RepID=A0A3Q0R1N4_AMPCI
MTAEISELVFWIIPVNQGLSNPGIEGRCPAGFRCVPDPTHLNQMAELPSQCAVMFSRVLLGMETRLGSSTLKCFEKLLRKPGPGFIFFSSSSFNKPVIVGGAL